MLLEEETDCFAFLAGHESFAAAEGAIGIAEKANKVRQKPLRVILNGLGKACRNAKQSVSSSNNILPRLPWPRPTFLVSATEEAEKITKDAGLDVYEQVKKIQPICFENACWAYTVGAAIAIKKDCKSAIPVT